VDHARWLHLRTRPDARREAAREAWRGVGPHDGLTWERDDLEGDAFIEKAIEHGVHGTVLEIGPGYGRLAEAAVRLGLPFTHWIGVDLSPANVAHLRERFPDSRFRFEEGDAETFDPGVVDAVVSSLTLKHVYPSFEPVLAKVGAHLARDGVVVVDLMEGGELRHFEGGRGNFIRSYTRRQVTAIFERCGLTVEFDYVDHTPTRRRLLAVGRPRPPAYRSARAM
jgi:SAM-dependent methyltransferase